MLSNLYAQALPDLVSAVTPQALHQSKLVSVNIPLAEQLGLPPYSLQQETLFEALFSKEGFLAKNAIAQKYGGHQFGQWNPDLGDGRGLLLGEIQDTNGQYWDFHLKGAGKTPYSRFGDGRAVLRSTVREYVISESLHALGIPSSRALCMIASEHPVQRETMETGAMLIRVCQSHVRFGHFEYFYHTGQQDKLTQLFDFVFEHHYPLLKQADNPQLAFLKQVVTDTADLIAKWQAFGFCHGVMNTDNMSIHGISFDFGPFAFLDQFIPDYICNHSDHAGRYAFSQQPGVALWNLHAFAQAFFPFASENDIAEALQLFEPRLVAQYQSLMQRKMGLSDTQESDADLCNQFMQQLAKEKQDYSVSFRALSDIRVDETNMHWIARFEDKDWAGQWLAQYCHRLQKQGLADEQRAAEMNCINPKFIPRNYLLQRVIDAAEQGNFDLFHEMLKVMSQPYDDQPTSQHWSQPPPSELCAKPLSCSS